MSDLDRTSVDLTGRHLAIRVPNWVGDLVMSTPILAEALHMMERGGRGAPARVSLLVRSHLADVLHCGRWTGRVVPLPGSRDDLPVLRELAPDVLLLLTNSFGAAWRAWRARVPIRAGAVLSGRGPLLTHALRPPTRGGRRHPIPTPHLMRDTAGLLGIRPPSLHPVLEVDEDLEVRQREELAELGVGPEEGYVLCCPGAAFGAAKLWPPERFAAVLDELAARRGLRAVVSGGPGEEELMRAVVEHARTPVVSLIDAPRDLRRLAPLARAADLVLVGDSGPRWYAAAFDVPCVTLMGPNFPELTATSLERCEIVRIDGLECSPCLRRVCPLEHHSCMRDIDVGMVLDAVERVFGRVAVLDAESDSEARRPPAGGPA